ncbi:MAG: hypothetical protein KDC38_03460 [Planctomycetes bacterium]|nr:hypothetical protein [Planctomycetota bacterium]
MTTLPLRVRVESGPLIDSSGMMAELSFDVWLDPPRHGSSGKLFRREFLPEVDHIETRELAGWIATHLRPAMLVAAPGLRWVGPEGQPPAWGDLAAIVDRELASRLFEVGLRCDRVGEFEFASDGARRAREELERHRCEESAAQRRIDRLRRQGDEAIARERARAEVDRATRESRLARIRAEQELAREERAIRFSALLEEAAARIDEFVRVRRHDPIHSYVSSDFPLVYRGLRRLLESPYLTGDRFCEWGSGFGVVADLAAFLDFESFGIEIEPELVTEAEELAASFEIPVRFACGNFIPGGDDNYRENLGPSPYLEVTGESAYEDLGLDLEDFDLVFAYPWPGEERTLSDIFEHYAAPGALLVLHSGLEGLIVKRKPTLERARGDLP